MPNKYIIQGATFNGDGTTSDLAASNGGVGAWNTITYFEGTAPAFGTLLAGDVVYIRSKDNTGADITRTLAAAISLGKSGLTTTPVVWVIDGGTIWAGISGTVTYTRSASYTSTILAFNTIKTDVVDRLVFKCNFASTNAALVVMTNGSRLVNAWLDASLLTYVNGLYVCHVVANNVSTTLENCKFSLGNKFYAAVANTTNYGKTLLISPRIEVSTVFTYPVFQLASLGNTLVIYGGSITGAGATTGQTVFAHGASGATGVETYGFEYLKTMTPVALPSGSTDCDAYVRSAGSDSGLGAVRIQKYGTCDSRNDNNYPTLNATFPDSASTPWSWRIYPVNTSQAYMIELPFMKVFADTAAAKTVTLEVLIADSFEGAGKVNKGSLWFDVFYIDNTTGLKTYATSLDLTATANLDTSTAGWSATSWGAVACLKRKIAVTTPTAIKQNTMIVCLLRGWAKSASSGDVIFVDPDPQLT
jgi:hypothetical protein